MRKSGILLSVSSLPSNYGIGTLGKSAYNFIDFLKASGQYYWQILPINPISFGNSPYQSFSAFAFNPYYIDLDELINWKLLKEEEVTALNWGKSQKRVDYGELYINRPIILKLVAKRFNKSDCEYRKFCTENKFWLSDYSLFMAVKEKYKMLPLSALPQKFKERDRNTIENLKFKLKEETEYHQITQFLFYKQWTKLKNYARNNDIHIIGDIPIYVSADSSDVWSEPKLFTVDEKLNPIRVAGCPPDEFAPEGQLWGNPLYDWKEHENSDYCWWLKRIEQASKLFDCLRIDHFRGFYSFYSIDAKEKNAVNGKWVENNGEKLMNKIKENFPHSKIIAEDLGFIDDRIKERMALSGFPGMKILQFGFDSENNEHLPHNYIRNSVVYTGTHDNPTVKGWQGSAPMKNVEYAMDYLHVNFPGNLTDAFIRSAMSSVCDTAIIPMQDYLKQDNNSRMNTPSTVGDNWIYRIEDTDMGDNLKEKIYKLTRLYGRL